MLTVLPAAAIQAEAVYLPAAEVAAVVAAVLPGVGKRHKKAVTQNATAFLYRNGAY